jgi:hypothetical protein
MSDLDATLCQRNKTHGDFGSNAWIAQQVKDIMQRGPNWSALGRDQKEALHMIASKIGRIMSGNHNEPDHWVDIAGYATLVAKSREGTDVIAKAAP